MADAALLSRFHDVEIAICCYENKHVESQYQVSSQQLNELEGQYQALDAKYKATHAELEKQEHKDAAYNSKGINLKKFGAQITGHLAEKQHAKHDLVEELKKKDDTYFHDLEHLKSQVQSHKRRHMDLENDQAQLISWRHEQEDILHKAFDGPCGSPEENAVEAQLQVLHQQKHDLAATKSTYETARQYLAGAAKQMEGALQCLRSAGFDNKMQMADALIGGRRRGDPLMEIMEQRRINQGKMLLQEAKQNLVNAKMLVPQIPRIQDSDIRAFGLLMDMAFGGALMDMMQQRKLNESMRSVENTLQSTLYALQWMDAKILQEVNPQLAQIERAYFAQRDQLKQIRYALIRSMISGPPAIANPPSYAPVSSETAFTPPTCWTTGNVTPQETQARQLVNSNSFKLFSHDSGSDHEVVKWLNGLSEGMGEAYGAAFIEYGYDSLKALQAASGAEFDEALGGLTLNGEKVTVKKPHQRLMATAHAKMH